MGTLEGNEVGAADGKAVMLLCTQYASLIPVLLHVLVNRSELGYEQSATLLALRIERAERNELFLGTTEI